MRFSPGEVTDAAPRHRVWAFTNGENVHSLEDEILEKIDYERGHYEGEVFPRKKRKNAKKRNRGKVVCPSSAPIVDG